MAEFGPPAQTLRIRLITELYIWTAQTSYSKSLLRTVTVNKDMEQEQRHNVLLLLSFKSDLESLLT